MRTIVSLIIFVILLCWIGIIYFSNKQKFRTVKFDKGEKYLLSRNMYFVIFTVCTAPIFLGSLSLLKYGLWFITILLLLFSGKIKMKFEAITGFYCLFYLWLCYTMTYSTAPIYGVMMLVKYSLPMLFLWLGYSAINDQKDLIILLKVVNAVVCIYCFFIGGQGCKLIPWFYYGPIGSQFLTYAGFADYLTSIFIVPILLYWLTKEKKYIFCALWMVLSTVLESVRTGMGGMMIVFVTALLLRYKWKAVPGVVFAGTFFLGIVLFVPEVNEKFFGDDAQTVSAIDIVRGDALSMDNMNTNGRSEIWDITLERFYEGHEYVGSGLGMASGYLKIQSKLYGSVELLHNDYVQIISDTGLVGIALLTLFYIIFILKVAYRVTLRGCSPLIKYTGIMALSSMAGIGFSMYFDNVVSHSMSSLVMPFMFLGFFIKFIDINESKRIS